MPDSPVIVMEVSTKRMNPDTGSSTQQQEACSEQVTLSVIRQTMPK